MQRSRVRKLVLCEAMTEALGEQRGLEQRNHNPRVGVPPPLPAKSKS